MTINPKSNTMYPPIVPEHIILMQEAIDAQIAAKKYKATFDQSTQSPTLKVKASSLKKHNKLTRSLILLISVISYLNSYHTKFYKDLSFDEESNSFYSSFKSPRTKEILYLHLPLAHPSLWLGKVPSPKHKSKPILIKHLNIIKQYV